MPGMGSDLSGVLATRPLLEQKADMSNDQRQTAVDPERAFCPRTFAVSLDQPPVPA